VTKTKTPNGTKPRPTSDGASRLRAVVYIRVSTTKQADKDIDPEGYSLPAQRDACFRRAEELGAEVVEVYMDRGESAKTTDRPSFLRMVERILTDRDIDYVILDKVNRFARNRRDDANVLFELRKAGCKLISVKENIDESPAGMLMHGILATIAEYESRNNGVEALKGMTRKAQVGGTPGRAPIGYLNVTRMIDGRPVKLVEPDSERSPLVQWAFDAYATGEWTLHSLTDALVAKGLKARPQGTRSPVPIHRSQVGGMLKNRYYVGIVSFHGTEYPGRHQSLISDDVFDQVQVILATRNHAGERQRTHNHYLKGSVFCHGCESRLCITNAKGLYLYYFCVGRQSRRKTCLQRYVPVERVEDAVTDLYRQVRLTEEEREAIREGIRIEIERQRAKAGPEAIAAHRRLSELENERRRLAHGVIDGSIPGDLARDEQDRIKLELKRAKAAVTTAQSLSADFEDTLERALELAAQIDEVYLHGDARTRRLCNQFFFDHIWIRDYEVAGQNYSPAWAIIKDPEFLKAMRKNKANPKSLRWAIGSNKSVLAPPAGLEPATHGLGNRRSIL